ncbi:hypothetical protein BDQ17DRAFT_1241290 [Cyathus striatus]|nr:hypothetical protein BDQ17DRAFT_1241290 [Cyathus striatus]
MTHTHFLLMGGFYTWEKCGKLLNYKHILDSTALDYNSEDILFPDVTEADINDKSKVNGLLKIIVALQSSSFIVKSIA